MTSTCSASPVAVSPRARQGPWTKDEDIVIIQSISKGITKWSEIADLIPGRIGKQCRERWFNHLDPRIKKGPWSEDEDRILIEAQSKLGNRWCEIAKMLPGRSDNSVKNRWHSAICRKYQAKKAGEEGKRRRERATSLPGAAAVSEEEQQEGRRPPTARPRQRASAGGKKAPRSQRLPCPRRTRLVRLSPFR